MIMLSKHLQAWVSASGCGVVAARLACPPLQNWAGRAVGGDTVAACAGVGAGARDRQIVSVKMAYIYIYIYIYLS